jgi:hypothetical protein
LPKLVFIITLTLFVIYGIKSQADDLPENIDQIMDDKINKSSLVLSSKIRPKSGFYIKNQKANDKINILGQQPGVPSSSNRSPMYTTGTEIQPTLGFIFSAPLDQGF